MLNFKMDKEKYNQYLNAAAAAAKNGDSAMYIKVFEAVKPLIYKLGNQMLIPSMLTQSEWTEHMQNLYIEVHKCIQRFEAEKNTKFSYYVMVCIRNYFYNYSYSSVKKHKMEESLNSKIGEYGDIDLGDTLADTSMNIDEIIYRKLSSEKLIKALSRLNDADKRLMILIYVKNISMLKISAMLDINYSIIVYRNKKILKTLKNFLKEF